MGVKTCLVSGENIEKIDKTQRQVISYRPLWTRGTVDARVHIDRYEHVERSIRDNYLNGFHDFLNGFSWFSQGSYTIVPMVLPDYLNGFVRRKGGMQLMKVLR